MIFEVGFIFILSNQSSEAIGTHFRHKSEKTVMVSISITEKNSTDMIRHLLCRI